jgi:RHS repeat-associated protein
MPGFAAPKISSQAYTPFGEQLGQKTTGFGFNGEWYDAATGMQNLRARQYEPALMRFTQQDVVRGNVATPLSLNRYLYVQNDPMSYMDPSGMSLLSALKTAGKVIGTVATAILGQKTVDTIVDTAKKIGDAIKGAWVNAVATKKAESAANAAKDRANALAKDWLDYCEKNAAYLTGDVKKEYEAAIAKLKKVKPGSDKYFRIILDACKIINKHAQPAQEEDLYRRIDDDFKAHGSSVDELLWMQRYTLEDIRAFLLKKYANESAVRNDFLTNMEVYVDTQYNGNYQVVQFSFSESLLNALRLYHNATDAVKIVEALAGLAAIGKGIAIGAASLIDGTGITIGSGGMAAIAGALVAEGGLTVSGAFITSGSLMLVDAFSNGSGSPGGTAGGTEDAGKSLKSVGDNKRANEIARQLGYEGDKAAEALKADYVGNSGSRFDIMRNTDTNEIILQSKDGRTLVPTGLFLP